MVSDQIWNDTAWMVRIPGTESVVGPVSLDQVRRGLAHQKLDRAAEIAPEGTGDWRNAGAFLSEVMGRYGAPPALSQAHLAAPSVDMSEYPDRPPPPPYAAGPAPGPASSAKASIRGLFPNAGRGKPPPPPNFRALAESASPDDEPLPSEKLPLPLPPRSQGGLPPPLPAVPAPDPRPLVHALPAPLAPRGGPRHTPVTPPAGGAPFVPAPSTRLPVPSSPPEPRLGSHAEPPPKAASAAVAPKAAAHDADTGPSSNTVPSPFHLASPQVAKNAAAHLAPATLKATSAAEASRPASTEPAPVAAVGLTPTSGSPTPEARHTPRDASRCARCGSDALLEHVTLGMLGGASVVLQLPDGTRAMVTAAMCGGCGDVRLTAEGARHLYEAMRRKST